MSKKILIATGGTGGHLFPSQQLAELLEGQELLFAGYRLEESPFFNRSFPYREIASAPSKKRCLTLLKGIYQSIKLLLSFRADLVIGFGSYHSFPVLAAAVLLRKKIVLFEANCSLGKVNRYLAPFVEKIAFQFPILHKKAVYVPLLPWIRKPSSKKKYSLDENLTTILVFGGSQGAKFINEVFMAAAKLLSFPFQVIHLTGKEQGNFSYQVPSLVKPFEEEMDVAYQFADFAVCRAGAGTIAELIQYQLPAVLIPYPYAHDHQRKNAEYIKEGARILLQSEASAERLALEMEQLYQNLKTHQKALRELVFPKTIGFKELVLGMGGNQ